MTCQHNGYLLRSCRFQNHYGYNMINTPDFKQNVFKIVESNVKSFLNNSIWVDTLIYVVAHNKRLKNNYR